MSPDEYRRIRKTIGTQAEVARLMGLARETVSGRETARLKITKEAAFAMLGVSALHHTETNMINRRRLL